MTKRMLIDATHAEETRVVVLDGNRLEDFDVETSTKKQLKGNIYLAKVVRVEPSLQAAFVEYGGGRHGFLAFGEIHPDYYQIPVADRQRLLDLQAEEAREEEERAEAEEAGVAYHPPSAAVSDVPVETDEPPPPAADETGPSREQVGAAEVEPQSVAPFPPSGPDTPFATGDEDAPTVFGAGGSAGDDPQGAAAGHIPAAHSSLVEGPSASDPEPPAATEPPSAGDAGEEDRRDRPAQAAAIPQDMRFGDAADAAAPSHVGGGAHDFAFRETGASGEGVEQVRDPAPGDAVVEAYEGDSDSPDGEGAPGDLPPPETIGGETDTYDGAAEARARRASRLLRNYRIQEVIRRRQIMLVQVVKEERGTKGAALTSYISLAGRFCVLMPNSPRGGGISRKITSATDRRRLKEVISELEIPRGMGLIVRTAGANRPKPEIRRDCEYLMRLWDDIRELTLNSVAPALIYEEASLIKRAIRDVYSRDVEDVQVDGEPGWRAAHDFMRMLMPAHARKVQLWRGEGGQPLFSKFGVEAQLDAMLSPTVQLRSGGYLVIAQTEALVSIDVNSGRSTRERGIEETALKTNLEAAEEVARQLRLRDLAGLIVIDFIDMESKKHNSMVERRLKDALKNDRARIQVGHISHFGLLEMSRQRLRPSLAETSFVTCPHCGGAGHVRSIESSAIHVLRGVEEEGAKRRASLIMVHCAGPVVMYLLNNKRERVGEIEQRYAMRVQFAVDDGLIAPSLRIDRLRPALAEAERPMPTAVVPAPPAFDLEDEDSGDDEEEGDEAESRADGQAAGDDADRRRRRRRRRGGRREGGAPETARDAPASEALVVPAGDEQGSRDAAAAESPPVVGQPAVDPADFDENGMPRSRGPRRSRRGGRRRGRREDGAAPYGGAAAEAPADDAGPEPEAPAPAWIGPTPADPFGHVLDIFDLMDQAEERRVGPAVQPAPEPPPAVAQAALDIPPVPADATAPVAREPVVEVPQPAPPPVSPHEPPAAATAPAPAAQAHEPAPATPDPEPGVAEPVVGAPVQPVVIGTDDAPGGERKRGWWRR